MHGAINESQRMKNSVAGTVKSEIGTDVKFEPLALHEAVIPSACRV